MNETHLVCLHRVGRDELLTEHRQLLALRARQGEERVGATVEQILRKIAEEEGVE